MAGRPFLATTGLSEFWDRTQPLVFLGSWCLRHDRRPDWEGIRLEILREPWDDRKRFYDATEVVEACCERLLAGIAAHLNDVHRVERSLRYWRIVVGPWLLHFVHAAYDRYVRLTDALATIPELQTIVLDPTCFRVPEDTTETVAFVCDDPYNLQLFSQLFAELGYSFPSRRMEAPSARGARSSRGLGTLARRTARGLLWSAADACSRVRGRRPTARFNLACSQRDAWALAVRTRLRALPLQVESDAHRPVPPAVFDARRADLARIPAADAFERVCARLLPQNLPRVYLEGYGAARLRALDAYGKSPALVAAADAWYFDEAFKLWAAESAEAGSRLLAAQHGGGYGVYRYSAAELHETRIADSYVAWGWARASGTRRNLPSPRLSALARRVSARAAARVGSRILFVMHAQPKYVYRFHSNPVGSQWGDYFDWEQRFLAALPERVRVDIVLRECPEDYGHAVRAKIGSRFPAIAWDDAQPLHESLRESRLVVIDHCGTSFLETLAANVPAILFWDPSRWETRAEAAPYFDTLNAAGVLWDSPEGAAAKVAEVADDPMRWWRSSAIQHTRDMFVRRYALADKTWLASWGVALRDELRAAR